MIYAIRQILYISGKNLVFLKNGFFAVKNVGILFQKIVNILMGEQESQNCKYCGQSADQNLRINKKL